MRPHTFEHVRPAGTPVMHQDWCDLLFVHWSYPAEAVGRMLPPNLTLDLFEGLAYVGLTPFALRNLRLPALPPLPYLSHFLECNLRTYVVGPDGQPGVWFFSLEAERKLAVLGARALNLPYHHAEMQYHKEGARHRYLSDRDGAQSAAVEISWEVGEEMGASAPGSLPWFLAERYCLYARHGDDGLHRISIHHAPWQLWNASILELKESLTRAAGLDDPVAPPFAMFSPGVKTEIWAPELL